MNTHYIITNREIVRSPKEHSNYMQVNDDEYIRMDGKEVAQENLRFGNYAFDNPSHEGTLAIFPEDDIATLTKEHIKILPSYRLFEGVRERMLHERRDTLVFIHGYNNDLKDVLEKVRILHELYVAPLYSPINTIVMFTWSSKSNLLGYREDARDAKTSGFALGRGITKCVDFLRQIPVRENCKQKLHLMAHSHGNKLLEWAMLQLSDEAESRLNDLFVNTILLAADVDRDALDRPNPLYDLVDISEKVHVFYHRKDVLLGVSETTKNPLSRLGRRGPKDEIRWLKSDFKLHDVSLTEDDRGDLEERVLNHCYYYTSTEVIEMIIDIFNATPEGEIQ